MSGNYGSGGSGPWPPAGRDPQWDDSVWQQDQPTGWGGQDGQQPGHGQQQPGHGQQQPYDNQGGYDNRGYGGQDYDQGRGYPAPGYQDNGYDQRGYGQPDPRTGPQQYPRTGSQQVQRGSGGMQQVPPGYDPRAGQRRPAGGEYPSGGYPQRGDGGYGQGGQAGQAGQRDDSFLPGFGPRDDFDGDESYDDRRRGRRGRAADNRAADNRAAGTRGPDTRGPATRGGPDNRGTDVRSGFPGQDQRARPRDDDRDPRRPAPRGRDDWNGNGNGGGNGGYGDDVPRKRRRGPVRRLAPWVALLVIVVPLAWGLYHVYSIYENRVHPADYTGAGTAPAVAFQVPSGASGESIAPTLLQDGVIASTRAFDNVANAAPSTVQLEPGYFQLKTHMSASAVWAYLTNPKNMLQTVVTIPEGKRASQVIAIVAKQTKIPLKDFQTAIAHPSNLGLPSYAKGKVEGYLFPATYDITPHETAVQILQAMVARFNQEATSIDLQAAANRLGISPTDVIIEASMSQAEGGSVSDYPKIAEVINNRLRIHMALQFDSVLLYGLNKYAINVTDAQIATPGPYNDFEHTGLPPGPISNPGDAAIQGILHPDTGNWLYFLTETGGKSDFSATPLQGQ